MVLYAGRQYSVVDPTHVLSLGAIAAITAIISTATTELVFLQVVFPAEPLPPSVGLRGEALPSASKRHVDKQQKLSTTFFPTKSGWFGEVESTQEVEKKSRG